MRAIVTGSTGFIGNHLVKKLKKNGHDVITYNSKNLDITKKIDFPLDVDVVFHLAANSKMYLSKLEPLRDFEINCVGTLNVLEAMRKAKIPKIIYSSSVFVYQNLEKTKETDPVGYNELAGPYGTSKLIGEFYLRHYFDLYGIKYNILRITGPYGPGMTKNSIYDIISRYLAKKDYLKIFIGPKAKVDYVYIDDVVKALITATDWENQIVNVASNISISPLDLHTKIKNLFDCRKLEIDYCGANIRIICHNSKIKSLGWNPDYDIDKGLKETVKFFNKNQNIKV